MSEIINGRGAEPAEDPPAHERGPTTTTTLDSVTDRVRATRAGLNRLLHEAEQARRRRAEAVTADSGGAVCAWNHFENIPTFYNWNNRPR